jgi:hypothetical protein
LLVVCCGKLNVPQEYGVDDWAQLALDIEKVEQVERDCSVDASGGTHVTFQIDFWFRLSSLPHPKASDHLK